MAVVVPLFRPHAIAAGFRYEVAAIALAALGMTAGIRLTGVELGTKPPQDLPQPPGIIRTFLRQPPTTRVKAVALAGSS
jgi:hypothetical protein